MVVDDLALAEKFDGIADVGIVNEAENVVVCHARLLFCSKVFVKVGEHVALDTDIFHIGGDARRACGVHARRVVDKILEHRRVFDLACGKISGKLVENCAYNFKMIKLFVSNVGQYSRYLAVGHGVSLIQISH